ncbi:MAG TPA: redoxin domain-containing protein [Acidimicrobiales bacterium]|nr:redoxin domain-containing protein [Acidimicrobiales bacterium]
MSDLTDVSDVRDVSGVTLEPAPVRRRHLVRWIAGGVALMVGVLVAIVAISEPAQTRVSQSPLLGKAAPPASGPIVSGPEGSIDTLAGRWVVVNFFATWCTPCVKEHPELVRFAVRHEKAGDAAVLQVLYGDRQEKARAFLEKRGGDWTVVDDPRGEIALDWGVRGIPESYLVSPAGVVVAKITGGVTLEGLERLLRERRNA